MKHIKKRFWSVEPKEKALKSFNLEAIVDLSKSTDIKNHKNKTAYLETNDGLYLLGKVVNIDGKSIILPFPDITLIYFNLAQQLEKQIKPQKTKLCDSWGPSSEILPEKSINEIYIFFGVSSGFIIALFTSLESFINNTIPSGYTYKNITSKKTETYTQEQIFKYIDFNTKIKEIIPEITGKNICKDKPIVWSKIELLKTFRDEIVHTKPTGEKIPYDSLINKFMSFKYGDSLMSVVEFMNHIKPNYIEECPCGKDF